MNKTWTPEEEAARLAARFEGVKQAPFAREHGVPGGASMVSQHIKGRRPINMEAALAYARGFNVPLAEISPRLAKQARDAAAIQADIEAGMNDDDAFEGLAGTTEKRAVELETIYRLSDREDKAHETVERLGDLLRDHNVTRRKMIGDLLGQFAADPNNDELATELALLLEQTAAATPAKRAPRKFQRAG